MRPLVSIVLPVYKVEKYLEECVESVRNQTLKDIEIILIDDGSPDNCPQMCDRFAAEDSRIRVIHQENSGVGVARNVGIDAARGDWIMYVDSDDWMEPDAVEVLYQKTTEKPCDVVIGSHYRTYTDCEIYAAEECTDAVYWYSAPEHTKYLLATCFTAASRNPQLFPKEMRDCPTLAAPWCKLYNREFLLRNQLRHPEDVFFHVDMIFNLPVFYAAKTVCFLNRPVYHYRMRKESIVGAVKNKRPAQILTAYERMSGFIRSCNLERELLLFLQVCTVLDIMRMIQRFCESAECKREVPLYIEQLRWLMQNEEICQAIWQVGVEKIGNRNYHQMLLFLQNEQYEELFSWGQNLFQELTEQKTKIKFS